MGVANYLDFDDEPTAMLIKRADDKSKRIALLETLQQSPRLDTRQKVWAKDELLRLRRGVRGERDAAHYIDNYAGASRNIAILHDLRFDFDGESAQIDHMLIDRTFNFFLLETKNFAGNVRINERGEFSVRYQGEREFGIPSPLEQSRRHERCVIKALEILGISGRVTTRPMFHHLVLVDPKATISRPPKGSFDTGAVIKADQFREWHERHVDKDIGVAAAVTGLLNLRNSQSLEESARLLARLHRPADLLKLPDFMSPKEEIRPERRAIVDNRSVPQSDADGSDLKRKLVCATCRLKISYAEGRFCWNNETRFGGLQYCRTHQTAFA